MGFGMLSLSFYTSYLAGMNLVAEGSSQYLSSLGAHFQTSYHLQLVAYAYPMKLEDPHENTIHIHSMGAFDSWIHGHQDHRPLPSVAELISALAPAWYQDEGSMEQNTGLKGPPMRGGLGSFANDHGKVVGVSRNQTGLG